MPYGKKIKNSTPRNGTSSPLRGLALASTSSRNDLLTPETSLSRGTNPPPQILPLLKQTVDSSFVVAKPPQVYREQNPPASIPRKPKPVLFHVLYFKTNPHGIFRNGNKGLTREIFLEFFEKVSYKICYSIEGMTKPSLQINTCSMYRIL